mmetsp:Transcript_36767/g.105675  ORF Transcript_36767/g.105675 Transcript_36767/m.105675 type:complete len:298 (+) Transcript_36767:1181-2074(+)
MHSLRKQISALTKALQHLNLAGVRGRGAGALGLERGRRAAAAAAAAAEPRPRAGDLPQRIDRQQQLRRLHRRQRRWQRRQARGQCPRDSPSPLLRGSLLPPAAAAAAKVEEAAEAPLCVGLRSSQLCRIQSAQSAQLPHHSSGRGRGCRPRRHQGLRHALRRAPLQTGGAHAPAQHGAPDGDKVADVQECPRAPQLLGHGSEQSLVLQACPRAKLWHRRQLRRREGGEQGEDLGGDAVDLARAQPRHAAHHVQSLQLQASALQVSAALDEQPQNEGLRKFHVERMVLHELAKPGACM